ncbi:hypothetical protein [Sporomusa sphaeroides]|nr:hypothetical protein [Sporomusa sphaeroides]
MIAFATLVVLIIKQK